MRSSSSHTERTLNDHHNKPKTIALFASVRYSKLKQNMHTNFATERRVPVRFGVFKLHLVHLVLISLPFFLPPLLLLHRSLVSLSLLFLPAFFLPPFFFLSFFPFFLSIYQLNVTIRSASFFFFSFFSSSSFYSLCLLSRAAAAAAASVSCFLDLPPPVSFSYCILKAAAAAKACPLLLLLFLKLSSPKQFLPPPFSWKGPFLRG